MKTLLFLSAILSSCVLYSQNPEKVRTTRNPDDRKYFIHKIDSCLNGVILKEIKGGRAKILSDKAVSSLNDELELEFIIKRQPFREIRRDMDEESYVIPVFLYESVLREFPQIRRLTLISKSTESIDVKITYHFLADKISFYSETRRKWVEVPYNGKYK